MYSVETLLGGECGDVLGYSGALGTFTAALFYSILRSEGGNPFIRNDALYIDVVRASGLARDTGRWAAFHDPNGAIRLEYARSVWNARRPGTDVVELG